MIEITISLDGSFDHTGHNATHGCSFAVDVYTGRPIDAIMTEKCTECDKCDDYNDNGNCRKELFHGASGDMEKYNALVLFGKSEEIGFRYTNYISDGDCKVHGALLELKLYGDIVIKKGECANHLGKRAYIYIIE